MARATLPSIAPLLFALVLLGIAVFTWFMRALVESDPDPFFLNLTCFAFAGLCIRTGEFMFDGNRGNGLLVLALLSALVVFVHVFVLKAHMHTTVAHYQKLLEQYRRDGCENAAIEHWARLLLHVTGTDFAPGVYNWLRWIPIVFPLEPREKSRRDAFSLLPDAQFRKAPRDENGLSARLMEVPASERTTLWRLYWITCVVLWIIFLVVILLSQKEKS